jgi:hypothetical protein
MPIQVGSFDLGMSNSMDRVKSDHNGELNLSCDRMSRHGQAIELLTLTSYYH